MASIFRKRNAKSVALSAAAMLAAIGLSAPAADAAATPAQKTLLTDTNRDCSGTVIPTDNTGPFGFANVVKPGSGKLVAAVALKGARPNTTYNLRLIQVLPGDPDCGSYYAGPFEGTLTTDALGDGNANIQEPVLPGASRVFVDLNGQSDPNNFYDTAPVSF
jgi:hypothetical protein